MWAKTELGDNQHSCVDRQTNIARDEGVRGQLRGQSVRRHAAIDVSNRGRQRVKSDYF